MPDTTPTTPTPDSPPPPNPIVDVVGAVLSEVVTVILDNEPLRLKIADFVGTLTAAFAVKVGDRVLERLLSNTAVVVPADADDAALQARLNALIHAQFGGV